MTTKVHIKTSLEIYELTRTCPVSENRDDWMKAEWVSFEDVY